ncbi:hypothetical protein [Aquibacillus saliphilus]|uniref:hypothetical protein n=1 Tax=Aquibacillus saliphilus TaxID=1909422 RepID=UPI001CF0800C|nr:hypothetical protein [Aquibacillus saliphilus]
MSLSKSSDSKEELLLQAVRTQHSILQLLDNTLLEIYQTENGLSEDQQNSEVINLSYRVRNIVARKPNLKEIYKRLEEDHGVDFSN